MPFPQRLLIPGEDLVLDLRPHPVALLVPALVTLAAVAAGAVLLNAVDGNNLLIIGAFVLVILAYPVRRLVWWLTSNFAVTTDRVIHREGFIAKRSMEIPLEAINDVRFAQGIIDRILGAGTLVIQSASEQGRQEFLDIRHPEDVQKTIYHQGEINKKRMYQGDRAAGATEPAQAGGVPPIAPSTSTELERLAQLRDRGVLTEDEFQTQKAKLLGG